MASQDKPYKLTQTLPGRILKKILVIMFATPAALSTFDRITEEIKISQILLKFIDNYSNFIKELKHYIIPDFIFMPRTAFDIILISIVIFIPVIYRILELKILNIGYDEYLINQRSSEDLAYSLVSFICLFFIYLIFFDFIKILLFIILPLLTVISFQKKMSGIFKSLPIFIAIICFVLSYIYFSIIILRYNNFFLGRDMGYLYIYFIIFMWLPIIVTIFNVYLRLFTPMYIILSLFGIYLVDQLFN